MKQKAFFIISKLISLKQSFMDRESPTLSNIFTGLHYLVLSVTSFLKKKMESAFMILELTTAIQNLLKMNTANLYHLKLV